MSEKAGKAKNRMYPPRRFAATPVGGEAKDTRQRRELTPEERQKNRARLLQKSCFLAESEKLQNGCGRLRTHPFCLKIRIASWRIGNAGERPERQLSAGKQPGGLGHTQAFFFER